MFAASRHALAETVARRAAVGKTEDGNGDGGCSGGDGDGGVQGPKSKLFILRLFKSSPFRTIASESTFTRRK